MANLDQIMGYVADKFGMFGKQLTMSNTSWSSGSCTITDSSKYLCFLVWAGGSPMFVSFDNTGSSVTGYSIAATTNNHYSRIFSASVNGDTWTLTAHTMLAHNASGQHNAGSSTTIEWIVGLIPKLS